jgi:hypothetical protein
MVRPDSELYSIHNAGVHPSQLGRTATIWRLPKLKNSELTCAPAVARTLELLKSGKKVGVSLPKKSVKICIYTLYYRTIKVASFDCGVSGWKRKEEDPTLGCNSCDRLLLSRSHQKCIYVVVAP